MNSKTLIRSELLKKRNELLISDRLDYNRKINAYLFSLNIFKVSDVILLYASYNNEVDTFEIFKYARSLNKKIAYPVSYIDNNFPKMKFYYVDDVMHLNNGYKGIKEPNIALCDKVFESDIEKALLIMPLVGFNTSKARLGYGKGFYDRYLMEHCPKYKIALSYSCQSDDRIISEKHDISPDLIITEKGII